MRQVTVATASLSAPRSTCGGSSGGKQTHSASTAILRFPCSSLFSLVCKFFKFMPLLQSFELLLEIRDLKGSQQRHSQISKCCAQLRVHPLRTNVGHSLGQHPFHIPGRLRDSHRFQRRIVGVPIASTSFSAKLCRSLGVRMKETEPVLVWPGLAERSSISIRRTGARSSIGTTSRRQISRNLKSAFVAFAGSLCCH